MICHTNLASTLKASAINVTVDLKVGELLIDRIYGEHTSYLKSCR